MGDLANCPRCGALFLKGPLDVCQNCYQEEEEKFDLVYQFIRQKKNRMATVLEVSSETGVEEKLIMKWVHQKRLHPAQFPNLTYPCERCSNPIREGKLCKDCADELKEGFNDEQPKTIAEKEAEYEKNRAYINVSKWES
ncbi:TIGR03826 family flagellar region protein [Aquisalibacillus elongatus]|uniref:Flagellar operon protein (TIGR03826 family) n=1 Tax=Aquisalibacillus elongatus TaxID=485577 RepID=A0A3N5BAB4_9BACI|nr:TIGR03826 family flagellar region protein [Aquisalibacillus elongatus]RPF54353.1 flagellar operon protein (TIGR03826 family) [Aquisalibacillus elongatus]